MCNIKLPSIREAVQGLGYPSISAMYASGETPESFAKAHKTALGNSDPLRAVNYLVCASALSAGQSRSEMYEGMAREILRNQQGQTTRVKVTAPDGDEVELIWRVRPSLRPELEHDIDVFISGGLLSDGRDRATFITAESALSFVLTEVGKMLVRC